MLQLQSEGQKKKKEKIQPQVQSCGKDSHKEDTITNFIQKFQQALKSLADMSWHTTPPDGSEMMHLFVQKFLRTSHKDPICDKLFFSMRESFAIKSLDNHFHLL